MGNSERVAIAIAECRRMGIPVKPPDVTVSRFDFVVIDMGRILEASTLRALDQADAIYITLQLTLPFIHDAKRLTELKQRSGRLVRARAANPQ